MLDLPTVLGLIATVGLFLFYIPQVVTAYRSPVMEGFHLPAWILLWVAVVALVAQGLILGIWTAAAANMTGSVALLYIIAQILRKRPRGE